MQKHCPAEQERASSLHWAPLEVSPTEAAGGAVVACWRLLSTANLLMQWLNKMAEYNG